MKPFKCGVCDLELLTHCSQCDVAAHRKVPILRMVEDCDENKHDWKTCTCTTDWEYDCFMCGASKRMWFEVNPPVGVSRAIKSERVR